MDRLNLAVIFGGRSSEHEVSCMSAVNVIEQIDEKRYKVFLIGITKEGRWLKADGVEAVRLGSWKESTTEAVILPDAAKKCMLLTDEKGQVRVQAVDLVFPVLHGLYGEDGTIQGLLEMAQIPYVGCGVLASALSMDKVYTKQIVEKLGIRQAEYVPVTREELSGSAQVVERVEAALPYPVFIKPSNAGSSCGVSCASDRKELVSGLTLAAAEDRKILVEEKIEGHEVECAVFGGGKEPIVASGVGEILAGADFYDYDAKYHNPQSQTITDPVLPHEAAEKIPELAKAIFKAVDGYGLARVDFFVQNDGTIIFNEINTMPGFTAISMYPMLWEARGVSKQELVEKLLCHALERFEK
ncbi:MAG: D-alanine--D-alanine ligase [Lachnospiraceae bacterium]|nr:D-alanine--D-alanine ligase [Lachnospiraceae bacterium]